MNNPKAERTLTAFDAWFNEQEGYSLRSERFEGDVEWLKAAFEAGALSTQQPMGEVHTEASPEFQCEWDENEYTVSWKGGPWIHIFASGKIAVNDGTGIRSFMVQDLGASALHPNQESGE